MKLIVGLGNPGEEHAGNRHNVGFMAVDRMAVRHRFQAWRRKFQGLVAEGEIGGEKCMLLKPQTYMNESGRSVGDAVRFLKIPIGDVIVIYDEIDLVPGKLKVKTGGGNAGHNGLRSISAHLENDYVRVRIGVGHPGSKDAVARYVLNDFAKAERAWVGAMLEAIAEAAPFLAKGDANRFMTRVTQLLDPDAEGEPKTVAKTPPAPPSRPTKPRGKPAAASPSPEPAAPPRSGIAASLSKWLKSRGNKDGGADPGP
jgi:PTH1 family peptidyl-tRNA hydrolase